MGDLVYNTKLSSDTHPKILLQALAMSSRYFCILSGVQGAELYVRLT
jgi:hypothetical protein